MDHQTFAQLLGNYGEFFGAIAVVVTLAYLAVQIRQGTHATRAASRDAALAHTLSFLEQSLDKQVIARASYKQLAGEAIDDFERSQLIRHQFYNFKVLENVHAAYEQGVIPEDEWVYFRGVMKSLLSTNEIALEMFDNARNSGTWWRNGFLIELENLLDPK